MKRKLHLINKVKLTEPEKKIKVDSVLELPRISPKGIK